MENRGRKLASAALAALAMSAAGTALAQRGRQREDMAAIEAALRSGNVEEVKGALETLGVSGSPRGIPILTAYVRSGPPSQVIETAVEAIGALGGAQSAAILIELQTHRRPGVRLRAVEASASIHSPDVAAALEAALDDSDAQVRGAAARGLAQAGTRQNVEVLFHAFERGVFEASTAIGTLGNPADAERFIGFLGRIPFDKMVPGLDAFLNRRDLGNPPKVTIIRRLQELATVEVKSFLQAFVEQIPARDRGPVRQAAEEAIARIAD
ncbi:MAG: HEAT repeat domain-containing protein [Deltaproteobacteria bacterium]|nr:HEAT repeat domain-containing protein [Deltaproteobacteria bacterium]